jgi:hypothetical protein
LSAFCEQTREPCQDNTDSRRVQYQDASRSVLVTSRGGNILASCQGAQPTPCTASSSKSTAAFQSRSSCLLPVTQSCVPPVFLQKKIEHLKDLSARVSDGWLKLDLLPLIADEGVMEHLVQVKGIGRWTAEMFLIFCFALAGRTSCPSATWDYARPSKRRIFSFRAPVAGSHPQYCQGVEAPLQRRHMVSVEVARAVQGNRIG